MVAFANGRVRGNQAEVRLMLLGSSLFSLSLSKVYESIFLPFIVAPFFLEDQRRKWIKRFLIHAIIFAAIIGIVFGMRTLSGGPRAVETSSHLPEEIPKILWSCMVIDRPA